MKIYLHIGTRKTGTSSIQTMCRTSVEQLNKLGYYWPVALDGQIYPHHEPLAAWLKKGDFEKVKNEIRLHIEQAQSLNMHSMIFSSEAFCILSEEHVAQLLSCFKGHPVTVQLFLRNIYDYARSDLFQFLKHSHAPRPFSLIIDRIKTGADYQALLDQWGGSTSKDQISIISYDENRSDINTAYLRDIGINRQADIDLFRMVKANVSLDSSTHLLLSGIGFYGANFSAKKTTGPFVGTVAKHKVPHIFIDKLIDLCLENVNRHYTHPDLVRLQQLLTKPPEQLTAEDLSGEDINKYLRRLALFLFCLSWKSTFRLWVKKLAAKLSLN